MTENPIRILVADDHAVVREGIRTVLEEREDLQVVAEASDGAEALSLAREHRPDVVILDITMPGHTGIQVSEMLREELPDCHVLILSMHDHPEYVLGAVRAGARGYILKDAGPQEVRDAVRAVNRGEEHFAPSVEVQLHAALRGEVAMEEALTQLQELTTREQEVLARVANGRTSREIAEEFGISPRTVETHRESLMRKLDIRTVAGLTRFAIEFGLVEE